jgi:ubiquinone biosynthesis protein
LNIEGLGRELYPDLDVMAVSKPELERILREKHGIDQAARDLRERLPGWLSKAPDMPGLLHEYLKQATEGKLVTRIDARDLEQLRKDDRDADRRTLRATSGAAMLFSGALLTGLEVGPWFISGLSWPGLGCMAIGALLLLRAHRG